MFTVLSISASPQRVSSTHALLTHVNRRILGTGHNVRTVQVRDLPAAALLSVDVADPEIAEAVAAVRNADASRRSPPQTGRLEVAPCPGSPTRLYVVMVVEVSRLIQRIDIVIASLTRLPSIGATDVG